MADAIQTLIAELRDYKQSENAQRIRATVETMVAAFQQIDTPFQNGFTYSTGPWTPIDASGAGLVFTSATGEFTQIGRVVFAPFLVQYPTTANANNASIGGLPFTVAPGTAGAIGPALANPPSLFVAPLNNTTTMTIFTVPGNVRETNANLSGAFVSALLIYSTS